MLCLVLGICTYAVTLMVFNTLDSAAVNNIIIKSLSSFESSTAFNPFDILDKRDLKSVLKNLRTVHCLLSVFPVSSCSFLWFLQQNICLHLDILLGNSFGVSNFGVLQESHEMYKSERDVFTVFYFNYTFTEVGSKLFSSASVQL